MKSAESERHRGKLSNQWRLQSGANPIPAQGGCSVRGATSIAHIRAIPAGCAQHGHGLDTMYRRLQHKRLFKHCVLLVFAPGLWETVSELTSDNPFFYLPIPLFKARGAPVLRGRCLVTRCSGPLPGEDTGLATVTCWSRRWLCVICRALKCMPIRLQASRG